jgi:hypothetical protein
MVEKGCQSTFSTYIRVKFAPAAFLFFNVIPAPASAGTGSGGDPGARHDASFLKRENCALTPIIYAILSSVHHHHPKHASKPTLQVS